MGPGWWIPWGKPYWRRSGAGAARAASSRSVEPGAGTVPVDPLTVTLSLSPPGILCAGPLDFDVCVCTLSWCRPLDDAGGGADADCTADVVETMKFACMIQNVTHYDPNVVTAERSIELATIECLCETRGVQCSSPPARGVAEIGVS